MLELGHELHLLVREPQPWRLRELAGEAQLHAGDLTDRAGLDAMVAAIRPHWVLHFATYGAYASQADTERCVRTNLDGTVHLLDAAVKHGVERLINTGSSSEYGFQDHAPAEAEPTAPNSLYAVTKGAATAYAQHLGRSGRLHATTLRLYSVYGPYEEPTRLIPTLIVRGREGTYPPLVSPEIVRDFVYVDDVSAAYEAALTADIPAGTIYNIGSGKQTSLRRAVEVSRSHFRISAQPLWQTMPERVWDTTSWVANVARARQHLRWEASTSFEEGFRRTAAWLSESPERLMFYQSTRTPPE